MGEQADCDQRYHSVGESGAPMIGEMKKFAYRLKANERSHGTTLDELHPDARPAHFHFLELEDVDVPRSQQEIHSGEPCHA